MVAAPIKGQQRDHKKNRNLIFANHPRALKETREKKHEDNCLHIVCCVTSSNHFISCFGYYLRFVNLFKSLLCLFLDYIINYDILGLTDLGHNCLLILIGYNFISYWLKLYDAKPLKVYLYM